MKRNTSISIVCGLLILTAVVMALTVAWMSPAEIAKVVVTDVKYSSNVATLTVQNNSNETVYMQQDALVQWNLTIKDGTIQKKATLEPISNPAGSIPVGGSVNFTVAMQDGSQFNKGETYRFVVWTNNWIIAVYSFRYDSTTSLG